LPQLPHAATPLSGVDNSSPRDALQQVFTLQCEDGLLAGFSGNGVHTCAVE